MKGRIFIVSSVAGGGKSTLIGRFLKRHPDYHFSVSYTSRPMRPGDVPGETYHFVTKEKFQELIAAGSFFEWALVYGNYYGTPVREVKDAFARGEKLILDIDIQGAAAVKKEIPDALSVFILPPDEETWIKRLTSRGTESEESLRARIATGRSELGKASSFDLQIVNDDLERAYHEFEKALLEHQSGYSSNAG